MLPLGGGNLKVARKSDISTATLHAYLNGSEMKLGTMVKLAQACGVSPSWLAFGIGRPRAIPGEDDNRPTHEPISHDYVVTAIKALAVKRALANRPLSQEEEAAIIVEWYSIARDYAEDELRQASISDESLRRLPKDLK